MRCEDIADQLPSIMDAPGRPDRAVVEHVEACLRCQAELAQYRKLLRMLRQLRAHGPEPPPGIFGDILAMLEETAERGAVRSALTGRPAAYIGVAAAAGAAGAVAVIASRSRARRPKMGLAG